ncbi:MAG: sodium-independent anion transporter, partial [Oscillospiraceae bacterium]
IFDLSIAIVAGLAFSCVLFVAQSSSSLSVSVVDVDNERLSGSEEIREGDYSNVKVAYISGSLFFGNVEKLTKALEGIDENCKTLIISARGLSHADSSAIQAIREFGKHSREKGVTVYLVGMQENVVQSLEQGGFEDYYDKELMLWSTQKALEHLNTK